MRRLFGTDGVRGIANDFLSCERALEIGRALGTVLSVKKKYKTKVIIGMDTRISSRMLCAALAAGICSVGGEVVNAGVIPTPAIAHLVRKHGYTAGVMISASHNSFEYNGIKIFGTDGFKLSDELEERIESIVLDNDTHPAIAEPERIGTVYDSLTAKEEYIEHLSSVMTTDLSGMKIGIDCANGAASATAVKLFTSFGADCTIINASPDGININEKCGSTYLEGLKRIVVENGLDLGVAFDGDADRCLLVDEYGNEIDGDFIMAIIAQHMKRDGKLVKNTVVGTVMTNLGFKKFCEREGIGFIAAKVGDRYVLEMMNQEGYVFGGEQSGHIIFREHSTTGDGQLTALMLLSEIKRSGKKLSELAAIMKKYPQYIVNIEANAEEKLAFFTNREIAMLISEAEKRIGDGRVVVRPSGTEPKIRVMLEGEDAVLTEGIAKELAAGIKEKLKEI